MADAYKTLYQGQLTATAAVLFTVPSAHSYIVKHITVVNTDTVDRTFTLYRNGSAGANQITPTTVTLKANGGTAEWDGTQSFAATDALYGVASVASKLTVTVDGDDVS